MELVILGKEAVIAVPALFFSFALFSVVNSRLAMFCTLVFLPAYLIRFRWEELATNALEVLMAAFVFGVFARWIVSRDRAPVAIPFFRQYGPALLLLIFGAAISSFLAPSEHTLVSLGILKGWFLVPILFAGALSAVRVSEKFIMRALVLSGSVVAVISLVLLAIDTIDTFDLTDTFVTYDGRLRGFYLSPNHLAMYLLPLWVLGYGLWVVATRQKERRILAAALSIMGAVLFLTQSFGAWFGLAGGLFVFHILLRKLQLEKTRPYPVFSIPRPRVIIALLAFLAVLAFSLFAFSPKFQDLASFDPRSSLSSRFMVWRVAWEIGKDHPLVGIGLGTFQEHYLAYQEKFPPYLEWAVPQPHNLFLAFWLQTGVLGLIGFLWLLYRIFRAVIPPGPYPASLITIVALSAIAAIVLHGLIDTPFWKNDLSVLFFTLLLLAVRRSSAKKISRPSIP